MSEKRLEARLIYNGLWKEAYKEVYLLTEDVTIIGRSGDIKLPYDSVGYIGEGHDEIGVHKEIRTSRSHARIVRKQDRYVLEDVGSKTGIYVNGNKLGEPQPEPWRVRFCHSEDYYSQREPRIRKRNEGKISLNDGDVITLGQEMYANKHEFVFRNS